MGTWIAIYICLSGNSCPNEPVAGSHAWHSEQACELAAKQVAQGMFAENGDKYGFKCKIIDYEPPNLKDK